MAGNEDAGTPPEVPEEYAATYRDAYLRALAQDGQVLEPATPESAASRPLFVDEVEPAEQDDYRHDDSRRWLLPFLIGGAVVVVVFGVLLVSSLGGSPSNDDRPVTRPRATATPSSTPDAAASTAPENGPAYEGPVAPVPVKDVTATCTAKPGVDSSGRTVRYDAANAADDDVSTAWRCDGSAVGERLSIALPEGTEVAEVGLIPGYAKTDPKSGVDRYAENNRITRVRWTFEDGTSAEQTLDPDPKNREVQLVRVPETESGSIDLEILAVEKGSRDTTAISQIAIAAAS